LFTQFSIIIENCVNLICQTKRYESCHRRGRIRGLKLARKLNNKPGFEVILLDRFNHHQFQPLFYQVATAGLDASNISFPLRKVFHKSKNVKIRLASLKEVIPAQNKIITDIEEISYDILVLAMGANTNFFNNPHLQEYAMPMKSSVEALQLRYRILQNFEEALTITDENELQRRMNIVITGGGRREWNCQVHWPK